VALLITEYSGQQQRMELGGIVSEICRRVNDPFEDNYADRARELFIASVFQGLNDQKWTKFDYHGIIKGKELSTGSADKRDYDVLGSDNEVDDRKFIVNILDVVSRSVSESDKATRKFVPIDTSEANRIATDVDLEPISGEVYWYMVGSKIFFHPNPYETMRDLVFIIEYLVNPGTFNTSTNMLEFYSVAYVYDAIDVATGKLLAEIGLA
tara:strand:- start:331 stop:960 length:630 start_codon:yes stop_codon:yes gene_type:complete